MLDFMQVEVSQSDEGHAAKLALEDVSLHVFLQKRWRAKALRAVVVVAMLQVFVSLYVRPQVSFLCEGLETAVLRTLEGFLTGLK